MKRNEKILAGGLALVVAGWLGWKTLHPIYIAPIEQLESDLAYVEGQVRDKEEQNFQLRLAAQRLTDNRRRGLPGDELDAQRLYQQWLTDLALASGLNAKVTPNRRSPERGAYVAVEVTLDGQATFKELQSFLRRFHAVDLLHRVVRFDVESPAAEGDPQLKFSLSAEGVRVDGAPKRNYLFPQSELKEGLPIAATAVTLPAKEFGAKPGDLLRIGTELAAVKKIEGDRFEIARAADGTKAADHAAGATVELLPLRRVDTKKDSPPVTLAAAIDSPFLKPRKYEPRFDGFADQQLVRGGTAKMTVKVADYDAEAGSTEIELVSAPEGASFDSKTGEISWTPAKDLPTGDYKVTLAANIPAPKQRLERTATIKLVDPNAPPTLEPVSLSEVLLGETVRVPLKGSDASGPVSYKLDQGPAGAAVNATSGEFIWTIPESFTPGDVTVTVSATDAGEPPLSAQQTFTIKVGENLKPFVKLVGAGSDGQPWAWLYDQSSNRKLTLRQGKPFKAAGLEGTVRSIGSDFFTYERNGEVWRIELGQSLQDVEKIASEPVAEADVVRPEGPAEAQKPAEGPTSAAPTSGTPTSASTDRASAS